jgi:DNA-binding PadR family transcriptional regulator
MRTSNSLLIAMEAHALQRADAGDGAATRPMKSPVNWVLLSVVIEHPGYGYQLAQRYERDYHDLLPVSHSSHIYSALEQLERRGFVQRTPGTGSASQPKPIYQATGEGLRAYKQWLAGQAADDRRRSRLFLRQLAVFAGEPDAALEIIDRYREACLDQARGASIVSAQEAPADTTLGLATKLLSRESRLAMQARLPLISYARERFEALSDRNRGHGAAGA